MFALDRAAFEKCFDWDQSGLIEAKYKINGGGIKENSSAQLSCNPASCRPHTFKYTIPLSATIIIGGE